MTEGQVPPVGYEEDSLPAEMPGWPKTVGIISIVWGSLLITCGVCATGFQLFGASMMPADAAANMPPPSIGPMQIVAVVLGIGLDAILIVAGAMTVGRKPLGRPLHLAYAALAIPMFAFAMFIQMQQQAVMHQWAQQNPSAPAAKWMSGGQGNIGQAIGWACGGIIGLGYPLFLLVWFGLVKKTPESMTGGAIIQEEPAA